MSSLELKPINLLRELRSLVSPEKQSPTNEAAFIDVFIKSTTREQITAEIGEAYYSFDPRRDFKKNLTNSKKKRLLDLDSLGVH